MIPLFAVSPHVRMVTFCDEPSFSEISMFIKGRDCLDDKAKLMAVAKEFMPESHIVKGGQSGWESIESRPSELEGAGPWLVKETNKNGGRSRSTLCCAHVLTTCATCTHGIDFEF